MKKIIALLLSLTLVFALVACGSSGEKEEGTTKEPANGSQAEGTVKTGLAVVTSADKSADAGDEDGLAQVDSTVVAVTVDADGKIDDIVIDSAQTKINFDVRGAITTDLSTIFASKLELGEEYGMKKASKIGKEWSEQAQALADYVKGKTLEEVKGISMDESGKATDSDLSSSVTVSLGGYIDAIEKAINNAKDLGAKAGDKLGLGITTNIAKSKNASADEDGLAQAYSMYGAVTFDKDEKITSAVLDGSQTNVNFDAAGKLTTDLATAEFKTKDELGEAYGMKKASEIGKEWNDQAAAFADYTVGKTLSEVKGIDFTEEGDIADEGLASSVTISVGDFISVIEKANNVAN